LVLWIARKGGKVKATEMGNFYLLNPDLGEKRFFAGKFGTLADQFPDLFKMENPTPHQGGGRITLELRPGVGGM